MKKTIAYPKPKNFHLDDDSTLLIGNRIHRVVGGQVIGQQNVSGDVVNDFSSKPSKRRRTRRAATSKAKRSARNLRAKGSAK